MGQRGRAGLDCAAPADEGEAWWEGSRALNTTDVVPPDTASAAPALRLTVRERWIVNEVVKHRGAPNKVIARALSISPNTLRNHLASIYAKLGVRRRVELVFYALENGLDRSSE